MTLQARNLERNLARNRLKNRLKNLEVNSPIGMAAQWQGRDDFHRVLGWHLSHGYVWSGADSFIVGRPIPRDALEQADEFIAYDKKISDVWFVWLAAGKGAFARFLEVAPFKLPYVAWHRNKGENQKLKVWSWDQYDRVTQRFRKKQNGN